MRDLPEPAFRTSLGTLYQSDLMKVLPKLPDQSVDLFFADPPFNLQKDYGPGIGDSLTDHDYLTWCKEWLEEATRLVKDGGSVWIYNLPKWNFRIATMLSDLGLEFRHWITIDMKMSLPVPNKLYPSHYSLLYFVKGAKPKVFNRPRVPIVTCRHCGGEIKDYGGHRSKLHPEGINLSDVWTDVSPVRHRSTKNRAANQLNPKILERVLSIASEENDVVLDPFGGSGTTYFVAEQMGRNWIGIELGDVEPIQLRLSGQESKYVPPMRGDSGKGVSNG